MDNIIGKYIKYTQNFILSFFRLVLGNAYERKMIDAFLNKYIEVRYYDITVYKKEDKFIEKINKELNKVAKNLIQEDETKTEKIKNVFALFTYILYLDDVYNYTNTKALIKALFEDPYIRIDKTPEIEEKLFEMIKNFSKQKKIFLKLFDTKDFKVKLKRLARYINLVDIEENCNLNPIYSEYAVNRAFSTGVTLENRFYLTCILLSGEVLKNVVNLDFSKKFMIDFPTSLFDKAKKVNRYMKSLENEVVINRISIRFTYKDYILHHEEVNNLISKGYNVSVVLDETFDGDIQKLAIFSYVFVYEKYDYYDNIIDNKESITSKIVCL